MGFVSAQGKQYLKSGYAFKCSNFSISENWFLSKFWDSFTKAVFPTWLAPNTITVIGGLLMVVCFAMLAIYHPEAPQWSHFLVAFLVFAYQTFDGCDGKQARRTQSSSPLGELFDHGIDALSLSIFTYTVGIGARRFEHGIFSSFFGIMWLTFFAAHWEHYHTDTFVLGYISASDAQLAIIAMHIYSAIFGFEIYRTSFNVDLNRLGLAGVFKVDQISLDGADMIAILALTGAGYLVLRSIWVVFAHIRANKVNKSKFVMLLQYWPLLTLCVLFVAVDKLTPAFQDHPILLIILGGVSFGFVLSTLNVSRVTNQPYSNFYFLHVVCLSPLAAIVANAAMPFLGVGTKPVLNYLEILKYGLAFVSFLYSFFVFTAVAEIANVLDISPFKIRKPVSKTN